MNEWALWALGFLGGLLGIGGAAWLTSLHSQLGTLNTATGNNAERIAALEAVAESDHQRLERIEGKLDRLLERVGNHG